MRDGQMLRKTLLFLISFILLAISVSAYNISIRENVQFSFGCPAGAFPKNCSGNYYFNVSNLTFFNIRLYNNYSMWNLQPICRNIPFFQRVFNYSHIFNWICCNSSWVANYTQCSVYDNQTLEYYDNNSCFFPNNIPLDNGTVSYCNYCSEELYSIFGECLDNSTQTVDWYDLNFTTCCNVTNITTDCSIYTYPYNDTTYQICNSTSANIGTPKCREIPEIGNRVREDCVVEIPDQYNDEEYKCFSIVKEKNSGIIVQVNPDMNRTYPVLESREYFEPMYSTVSFYYTAENLNPETEYTVRLECSSPNRIIYSEYPIERKYENLDWVFYRIKWLKGNAPYIIGGLLVLVFILALASVFFRWVT